MPRTIVIGDIHGCLAELEALLDRVEAGPGDRVVSVGDLVAKGPDSAGVVRRAREIGMTAVVGNHDHKCLRWWRARREGDEPPRLKEHHQVVCDALSEDDWQWLDALPLVLRLPDVSAIVVHGGLVPEIALEDQEPGVLMNLRSIRSDGSPSSRVDEGLPWASLWSGPEHVVFGHDAVRGLQRWPHATGLDTGCVYGGQLTALVLPDHELVSVDAGSPWAPRREDW